MGGLIADPRSLHPNLPPLPTFPRGRGRMVWGAVQRHSTDQPSAAHNAMDGGVPLEGGLILPAARRVRP